MSKSVGGTIVPYLPLIKHLPISIPANWRAQCSGLFVIIDPELLKKFFKYIPAKDLASLAVTCKYLQDLTQADLEIHKKSIEIFLKKRGVKKYLSRIPRQVSSKVRRNPLKHSPFQLGKEPLRLFDFPPELNQLILSYLPYEDLMRVLRTSKGFQAEVFDQVLLRLKEKETFTFNELQELKSLMWCAAHDEKVKVVQDILAYVKAVDLLDCDLDDAALQKLNLDQYVNLKTVDLSGSSKITDQGLTFLPEQITELSLFECTNITDKGTRNLPKGLEIINIRRCFLATIQGIADLPKTIESLHVEQITQEELKGVSGLKKLDATIESLDQNVEFPSTLEELKLSNTTMSPAIMAKLPLDLKKLELQYCYRMQGEISFPKGLTHLTLFNNDRDAITSLKLPENLEEFSLDGLTVTEAILSDLSKGLQRLHISDLTSITAKGREKLRSLKELTRLSIPYVNNPVLENLPPQLEDLTLGFIEDAKGEALKHLPLNLKKLSLQYQGNGLNHLPQGIESLVLSKGSIIKDEQLSVLPQNLRSLKFWPSPKQSIQGLPSGLTDLTIMGSTQGGKWGSVSVLNIFRAKEKRKTKFISSSKLQTNWLENLPSGIKRLKLSFFFGITLNDLKHLPKNIRELDLDGCDISNEEMKSFLKHLPKELTKLNRINHHHILKERKN